MTNEQKLLVYLYGVDSIQHKQLAIALSDIPYQCVTKALRAAKKHGYGTLEIQLTCGNGRGLRNNLQYVS